MAGLIYIVRCVRLQDRIRIGYSKHFHRRLIQIATVLKTSYGIPKNEIQVLGTVQGTLSNERDVHHLLRPYRCGDSLRSWYFAGEPVLAFIDEMLAPRFRWDKCKKLQSIGNAKIPNIFRCKSRPFGDAIGEVLAEHIDGRHIPLPENFSARGRAIQDLARRGLIAKTRAASVITDEGRWWLSVLLAHHADALL
jgi:hypothetical protein